MSNHLKQKRNLKDSVEDTILLLYLLNEVQQKIAENSKFEAQLKLMKLVFLAELEMVEKEEKGFNFFFNVFKHGPCSNELFAIVDDLKEANLIDFDYDKNSFILTGHGKKILLDFLGSQTSKHKIKNQSFFKKIDSIVDKYSNLTAQQLKNEVYAMTIKTPFMKKEVQIGEAVDNSSKQRLLMRLPKCKKAFYVSPDWVETFGIVCNPDFKDLMKLCHV